MRFLALDDPGLGGSIARFWQRSYAGDYLGFIVLMIIYLLIQFFIEPFHRMFSLDDRSKSYPHALVQRVSSFQNVCYAGVGPLLFFSVWSAILRPGFHQAHVTILGFLISLALTSLITDIIKNAVGRPRPDLIARCQPALGTPAHELVTIHVCTETNHHTLHDGWRSFPSGHSSFAFAGLGYLAVFLAGQMHVFRPRTDLTRVLIFIGPLIGAALIAMSRLSDYRHDVFDVTAGSLLGISVAYFSYRRYYRSLRHAKCDQPYPSVLEYVKRRGLSMSRDSEQQARNVADLSPSSTDDEDSETFPLHLRQDEIRRQEL